MLSLHGLYVVKPIEHAYIPAEFSELCLSTYNRTRDIHKRVPPTFGVLDLIPRTNEAEAGTGEPSLNCSIIESSQCLVQGDKLPGLIQRERHVGPFGFIC